MEQILTAIEPAIMEVLAATVTLAISLAAMKVRQYTGIKIEEKHRLALHDAIMSGVAAARKDGPQSGVDTLVSHAIDHAKESVPDAIRSLRPTRSVLVNIAKRYVFAK